MSRYIDQDKVLEYIIFGVVGKDITCGELKRAIENLPAIEVSEGTEERTRGWIPARKNGYVPDHEVMCQDKYEHMMIGYVDVDEYGDWICENDSTIMYDVVAWRSRPEPYRESEE